MLKIFLPIIILAISFSLSFYLFKTKDKKPTAEITERIWQVETLKMQAAAHSPSIILYGLIEAPARYHASAPAFGRVEQLLVKEGQAVKKGQLLATMDEADFLPALKKSQAQVASLDAQIKNEKLRYRLDKIALQHQKELLILGQQSLKRTEDVYKKKLASLSEADEAKKRVLQQQLTINTLKLSLEGYRSRLVSLQASREQALAELDKVKLSLKRSQFYAPFNAVIAQVDVAVGDQLASGKNLFSLYPPNNLEVRTKIPFHLKEKIAKQLKQGVPLYAVSVTSNQQQQKQRFNLVRLSGQASISGVDAFFTVVGEGASYRPGSFLQLRFFIPSHEALFSIPYTALYGKNKLYKLNQEKNNELRMQAVNITPVGDLSLDNQNLLLFSSAEVKDGDRIIITHLPNALNGLKVKSTEQNIN